MPLSLNALDRVEILTLQDNFIDMTTTDNSPLIYRAGTREEGKPRPSILAEHGFSALVRTTAGERTRTMLFDFGFSEAGAAYNARALEVPLAEVEAVALSHGHGDHMGGFGAMMALLERPGIELVVHPAAFKAGRYVKYGDGKKAGLPRFTREMAGAAGARIVETPSPRPMLGGDVCFLGEIPRRTAFEKGMPNAFFAEDGVEKKDPIEDDTSLCMHLEGKGLIVLTGCAHAGIVNTVRYAREVTGIESVHAIMGGFHLNGPALEAAAGLTIAALQEIAPRYLVPTHCTGRTTIQRIEAAMPGSFVLNMSGTRLTFS